MEDNQDVHEPQVKEEKVEQALYQQEIRMSSNGSSPNIEEEKPQPIASTDQFQLFDKLIASKEQPKQSIKIRVQSPSKPEKKEQQPEDEQSGNNQDKKKEDRSIIEQVQKQWIIKSAELQRIGGTYDFFAVNIERYRQHLLARKIVLSNITAIIDKNKVIKSLPIIMLKDYFKDYASLGAQFHQKSYKFEMPQREESDNKLINMRIQLKSGFQRLINLRKQTGNQLNKIQKFLKTTVLSKIQKAFEVYLGVMAGHQNKTMSKREHFEDRDKKIQKRIDKISKVYNKGRVGTQIDQDVFQEMTKFVKEQKQLRYSIYDWGKQILNLRKNAITAEYSFFNELQSILSEFKSFNNTIYQLHKKKYPFSQRLKDNIEKNYLFENICTPLDNDYIRGILNFKNKSNHTVLVQADYEQFLSEEYFGEIITTSEFLKGTIKKYFPVKNIDEELIQTVSGNLVFYNKKTLEVKYKMKIANTTAQFEGYGCVTLKQIIKGIIFDSDHIQKVHFRDDNRAEELTLFLSEQFKSQIKP